MPNLRIHRLKARITIRATARSKRLDGNGEVIRFQSKLFRACDFRRKIVSLKYLLWKFQSTTSGCATIILSCDQN
jgi:hypothetical protein